MRRRALLCCLFFLFLTPLAFGTQPKYKRLPLGSVVADGWLRDQLLRARDGMGGNLDLLEPEMIAKPYVDREHQSAVIPGWSGEISGEYWYGLVQLAFVLNDEELIAKAERWVRASLALQEPDGYLGSYRPTENRQEDYCAWSANWYYRSALSWSEATGEKEVVDKVHNGLLWFVEHWAGDAKTDYVGTTLMESMIDVYLATGDERLGEWCVDYLNWLDAHDQYRHGRKSLERPQLEFNEDHSVSFAENVKHPALVSLFNDDPSFVAASENGLKQVFDRAWQCTDGPVSNLEYHGPPASNHETEYCAYSTYVDTFWRMGEITGDPKYGDLMERTTFNGAQGARKNDERAIAYNSSPNQFFATMESSLYGCLGNYEVYAPNIQVACCPAQSVRLYPEYVRAMFMRETATNALAFFAYGPATAKFNDEGTDVVVKEKTLYPFNGKIQIELAASKPWKRAIRLKKPEWAQEWTLELDGAPVEATLENGWLTIDREWQNDSLTVEFVMTPRVEEIKDVHFQTEPLRVVRCGALLFTKKYEEVWNPIPGIPITALPEDWSWFDVGCKTSPTFYSLVPKAWEEPGVISVQRLAANGNVWDNPPIKLLVPMIATTKKSWPRTPIVAWRGKNFIPYENPATPDDQAKVEYVELVPFGCSTMRQTCFTVVK